MTKGEAINWLINISADIGKREHKDLWHYEQALFEIREMLEAQPEQECEKCIFRPFKQFQPEPHWIPCSERLPEEAQECFITAKDGTVCQGMFTRRYGERSDSGFICNGFGFAWLNAISAWMPCEMPEPYKER